MSYNEFKARALYDFNADGPNELSFYAGDILTITSTAAGHGWWYAKNSSGRVGVIPENYVETLADPPEPQEPPPPLATFAHSSASSPLYPSSDLYTNFNRTSYNDQPPSYLNQTSSITNNWQNSSAESYGNARPSSHQSNRRDSSDDDSFSEPEDNVPHSTMSQPNTLTLNSGLPGQGRPSLASVEPTRAAPKARFFDKHGLDNYLLNGAKAKTDDHVEIMVDDIVGVMWSPNPGMPPFSCKIENPSKEKKLAGLKQYIEYKIQAQIPGGRSVGRRYKQFDWLHEQLVNKFRFICVPPLPGKQIAGRFEDVFIEERRRLLELWLNRICRHPVLCATQVVQHFISCELTEKNKKDWKTGKRKAEKDESKEAAWLQCVTLIRTGLNDQQIQSQIDTFANQQPALESQLKSLSQGINKYLERHTEVYEKDLTRISELFFKVHGAIQADTVTSGNRELSQSINKIGESYKGMADSYRNEATEGLRNFNERLQEYIGILGCFPSILSIQRSATDFMRNVHQRAPSMNNDFSSAIHRNHVLNHVVLAEINFFQKEKVADLNNYLKTLVDDQTHFYQNVTEHLRDASHTFK